MNISKQNFFVLILLVSAIFISLVNVQWCGVILSIIMIISLYKFYNNAILTPDILICMGFVLPLTIAIFTPTQFIFRTSNYENNLPVETVIFCLIIYLLLFIFTLNPIKTNNHPFKSFIKVRSSTLQLIQAIGILTFLVIARLNNFNFPIIQGEDIVESSKEFFSIPGSSTVFMLSYIASIILHARFSFLSRNRIFVVLFFDILFIGCLLLTGKRMGLALLFLSWLFLFMKNDFKLKKKKIIIYAVFGLTPILLSSYLRLSLAYENYFMDDSNVLNIQSLSQFFLIQPLLYIVPNFHNISLVLKEVNFIAFLPFVNRESFELIISQPWNMIGAIADLRSYPIIINIPILFLFAWLMKKSFEKISFSEKSLVLMCYLYPKFLFLFAGNLFDRLTFYLVIILLITPSITLNKEYETI